MGEDVSVRARGGNGGVLDCKRGGVNGGEGGFKGGLESGGMMTRQKLQPKRWEPRRNT
jgi:hypothetical protein